MNRGPPPSCGFADTCLASIPLTDDEAAALAELLGASVTLSRLRGDGIIPSLGPEVVLEYGDVLVAVGTRKGLASIARLIDRGPS